MTGTTEGNRGAVVITGASTGIGRTTALHLDGLGFRVFAGVRKAADGEALARDGSGRLTPLSIDVTDSASIEAAAKEVAGAVGDAGIAGLVNNAGIVVSGPLEFVPLEELRHQMEVNFFGLVAVTQAFLPLVRKAKGRIVNMSSIGGKVSTPFLAPYAASKHAVEGLSDSLRRELRSAGMFVAVVEPGAVATPIWDKGTAAAEKQRESLPAEANALYGAAMGKLQAVAGKMEKSAIPPEEVARCVTHALTAARPKTRYLVGTEAKVQNALATVLSDRMMDGFLARFLGI